MYGGQDLKALWPLIASPLLGQEVITQEPNKHVATGDIISGA